MRERGMLGGHAGRVHYEMSVHEAQAWTGRARSDQGTLIKFFPESALSPS